MNLDRQKIITILLITSICLLIGNIILSKISPAKANSSGGTVTIQSINEEFEKTLLEFDLKSEWFKKLPIKETHDSLEYTYRIRVPKDLPVTVILNELTMKLSNQPVRIFAREKKINKQSIIRIFSENALLHESEFVTDTSISRDKPVFGFLINDIDGLSNNELTELLAYPEKFSLLLTPSQKSESLKRQIKDSGREYVILLHDDISEVRFRLDESYNSRRLNGSVSNILKAFDDAKLFLLDEFANPELGNQVKKLFDTRKLRLVNLSKYSRISEKEYINLSDDLANQIKRSGISDIFLVTSKDFLLLYNDLKSLRKRGYKFVMPSAINYCI